MSKQHDETKVIKSRQIKLKNKRVIGGLMKDGSISWRFKRLLPDRTIYVSRIRITRDAFFAMMDIATDLWGKNEQEQNHDG
jgi:hypothetical protein